MNKPKNPQVHTLMEAGYRVTFYKDGNGVRCLDVVSPTEETTTFALVTCPRRQAWQSMVTRSLNKFIRDNNL